MSGRRLEVESSRPHAVFAVVATALVSAAFAWVPIAAIAQVAAGESNLLLMAAVTIPVVAIGSIVWVHLIISVQGLVMSGPIIAIGPDGFRDRRISSETIPWERFRWSRDQSKVGYSAGAHLSGRTVDELGFEVDGPYRAGIHYRVLALFFRAIRRPGWRIVTMGTAVRADQLAGAIRSYCRRV